MSNEQELQQLREQMRQLQERLTELNRRLEQMSAQPAPPVIEAPPIISPPQPPATPPPVIARPVTPAEPKESFEVRLGTYWLPRIGMVLLLTGMVFLVTWSYRYLAVPHKVALGYLSCLVLGGLGLGLEKKMPQFARILQAGSLALAYFVTYAAHFVEAFRIIHSPAVALTMLSVVVLFIVGVAQERQSPALAGMALFFGYYTSVVSGVATFTLAANAVLALAAIFFLARNRWVPISYGAVLATYIAYALWVWKLSRWGELDRLIFDEGYLSFQEFRLRAAFLSLYWVLFAAGGLIVRRDAISAAERTGLLTLNNVFFFVLFSLLMHHAYPDVQWQFQFLFGGALLTVSSLAYQRFRPDRAVMDALFAQGVAVATLGLISYLDGGRLAAALAVEALFLLWLSRWMGTPWVAWIARVAFAVAFVAAWPRYSGLWTAWFAAVVGFVCARFENRARKDNRSMSLAALYFATVATVMAMRSAEMYFDGPDMPWVWVGGAVIVGAIGAVLRTREVGWAAHVPLAWAHILFWGSWDRFFRHEWALDQSLALIAVTFGFGVVLWGVARAANAPSRAASGVLAPYAFFAMAALLLTTMEYCPARWRLTAYAAEMLVLVLAGCFTRERTFVWLGLAALIAGLLHYAWITKYVLSLRGVAWLNAVAGVLLAVLAERLVRRNAENLELPERARRVRGWIVVLVTALALIALRKLAADVYLTVSWAGLGFALLAFGLAIKERPYRPAGLVVLAFSLLRAVFYDLGKLETLQRILSFLGLGVILLVLAFLYARNREKISKWL